jgi:hypothetical protein
MVKGFIKFPQVSPLEKMRVTAGGMYSELSLGWIESQLTTHWAVNLAKSSRVCVSRTCLQTDSISASFITW